MAKKISDKTIANLKAISPSTLVAHGVLKTADDFNANTQRGYCCPLCGSGEHTNGTGGGSMDSENRFYCFVCRNDAVGGHKLSTLDLFARARGLEGESFNRIVREMAAEFGEPIDEDEYKISRRSRQRFKNLKIEEPPKPKEPSISADELALIQSDILQTSDDELEVFVKRMCGGKWRGFDFEFLRAHGIKFVYRWWLPSQRLNRPKYMPPATKRILIPSGSDFYVARLVGFSDYLDEKTKADIEQKYPKMNAGSPRLFRSRRNVLDLSEPIFAVEGALDALSIEYSGYGAVALNGRGNGYLLVDELKKRLAEKKKLPTVIIMMDSDEQGRDAAPKLYDALIDIGCVCCVRYLFDEVTKRDFNDILVDEGKDNLRGILQNIVEDSLSELDATAQVLAEREEEPTINEVADSENNLIDELFQGDWSDADFAGRLERFCGSDIRWLTDDKSWLLYRRNEFGGGMWQNGGEQNSALLPFAKKMTDTMLAHAQNKDEHELAARFKSAKKVLQSITMMKSLDSILITSKDLDKHKHLICCLNGVVDLRTGELYQAEPKTLLMTQSVNAVFGEPRKESVDFVLKTFAQIQPDEMTRRGLIRWLAYCLTGETSADKFMVWTGDGSNGKGVIGGTVLELFDGYGVGLSPRALLKSNRPVDADKATTALNGLVGKRFALSEEMPMDGELDSSLVKNLTGGDKINLRSNYKEYRTLINVAKINISGNYTPRIENTHDKGIRRRLLNMPFTVTFGTDENPADFTLKRRLIERDSLNALFAILVRNAKEFYDSYTTATNGLIISELMMKATQKHLQDSDFVEDFLSEYYEFGKGEEFTVKVKDLIDELKEKYPAECRPFRKRADLISLVAKVDGITIDDDRHGTKFFKGIRKPQKQEVKQKLFDDGEIISSDDYKREIENPPFD